MGETSKAIERRKREGFFEKYCQGKGIDIGCQGFGPAADKLTEDCTAWDLSIDPKMDATFMDGVPSDTYDFVYSSHCLEDIPDCALALKNWYRILKRGGFLLIYLPHRDLFELVHHLPSTGNIAHVHFFLIDRHEPPATIGLVPLVAETLTDYDLIYVKKCDEGYKYEIVDRGNGMFSVLAQGEYSIELVLRKGNETRYIN